MKIIWGSLLLPLLLTQSIFSNRNNAEYRNTSDSTVMMNVSSLRDTLYTLHPFYIEINLTTQTGYLHSRDGSVKAFGISTGNSKIKEAISTKEGLFVIQSKMTKWYSRQFDNTLMLNWMGFNYGTGFHALKTSGYYRNLGKKKSSHGCVRISRTTAKFLFDTVKIGTPVLVHKGQSLITVAFTDSTKSLIHYSYAELQKEIALKNKMLSTGRYLVSPENILIDKHNIGQKGLPLGDPKSILKRPVFISQSFFVRSVIPPAKGIMYVQKQPSWKSYNMQFTSK